MASVKCGIGVVGVVVVAFANVATTRAQSDELPRRLSERISRTTIDERFPSAAAAFDTEVKLTASDGEAGHWFGVSVAISGDTAIVGDFSGAVYVYRRVEGGAGNWGEVAKIIASDGASSVLFGFSVAISGDWAIVGAPGDNDNGLFSGSAYVYRRDKGGLEKWGEVTKITPADGAFDDQFGSSVAISGDTLIVGAARDDDKGRDSGSAYVFRRGEDSWAEVTKITASDGTDYDYFGGSTAISRDWVIVGASGDDDHGLLSGSAYVYRRDRGGVDNWGELTKITASDGEASDRFGNSVAISADWAIVGARGDDGNWPITGSAYLYGRGLDAWTEVTKISATDGVVNDVFGVSVAISGDIAIVGVRNDDDFRTEPGSAYVYQRDEGGLGNWGEVTKIARSDAAGGLFGVSVAISGDTAIVGAPKDDNDKGDKAGSAYVYFETQVCLDDAECADGDACNGAETCNTETGECLPGIPVDCDDGDECNGVESCDLVTGDCIDGKISDCDGNGIDDVCDVADCGRNPGCDDCDGNGSLDRCDIAGGQPDVNGNGVLDQCEPCTDNASCDDSEPCSFDRCMDNVCWYDLNTRYGDVAGEEGVCGPNGDVDLLDILALLDGFGGEYAEGCELVNIDIAGNDGSCVPNGTIDLFDILGVLDAFQGVDRCCAARR